MITELMNTARRMGSKINWDELAPRCRWERCRRRTRWQGVLRKSVGVRFADQWYCGAECLREELERRFEALLGERRGAGNRKHRTPVGLLLLSRGILDEPQLYAALQAHRETGARVGECLRRLGIANEGQITAALAVQWGCPVYPAGEHQGCERLVPRLLQLKHRMTPVHLADSGNCMFVGFAQDVNYTVLLAIEQMLDCHAEPCMIDESELERRLGSDAGNRDDEVAFTTALTAKEMAMSVAGYAERLGAARVRVHGCLDHIWVRVERAAGKFDLFFQRP